MNSRLIGEAPVDTQEQLSQQGNQTLTEDSVESDQIISLLHKQAQATPQDKEAWRALGQEVFSRFASSERHPSPALALTAVDAFSQVLKIDPYDSQAMLALADISFAQQAFTKSEEFYGKYLALNPSDLTAKSKHASSLTFLGKFDQAVKELKSVLIKQPKDFHALAYLAITYAQMGDKDQALKIGKSAVEAAPSQEAKERFTGFLDSIANSKSTSNNDASAPSAQVSTTEKITALIKANPVAGPKFVTLKELGNGEFALEMKDFPMEKMPPFAKQKFFDSLRQHLSSEKEIKRLIFIDSASGAKLDNLSLNP